MSIKMSSNISSFSKLLGRKTVGALNKMGPVGLKNIKDGTPVDTGKLKKNNGWFIENDILYFVNDVKYARHVEYGTYMKAANPFMRNGIIKSRKDFIDILLRELGV